MRPRDFLIVPAFTLAVMVLNVLISFIVVWAWSVFVEPGHPQAYYEAFALKAAPVSSVVFGAPLMFLAGLLVAGKRDRRGALIAASAVGLLYMAIDVAVLLAYATGPEAWFWGALSYTSKIAAALAGALVATRRT